MVTTTFSLSASTSRAGKFFGRGPRVAGLAFLEAAVHRRLAAADLVIALVLGRLVRGHGGSCHPVHPARRGRHRRPLATAKFRPTYNRIVWDYQLLISVLAMSGQCQTVTRGFTSFPCWFPAKPSIFTAVMT